MAAEAYVAVHLAFLILLTIAVLVLGIFSTRNVRRQGDPARSGVLFYHISLWLFFASCVLAIPADAASLAVYNIYYREDAGSTFKPVDHISLIASYLDVISTAMLLVCTSQLAIGTKSAATQGAQRSPKFSFTIKTTTGVAIVCYLAYFGYRQYTLASTSDRIPSAGIFAIIGFAGIALLFIQAVAIFVFALVARRTIQKAAEHMTVKAGYYVEIGKTVAIITGVNLIIFIWIVAAAFLLGLSTATATAWDVGNLVVGYWGTFGLLLAIYYLGKKKKESGLWSLEGQAGGQFLLLKDLNGR